MEALPVLLDHLAMMRPNRVPVGAMWRLVGMTRGAFGAFVEANRDALARAGVVLHAATVSQVGPRLSVQVDGRYIAALSLPPKDSTALHTIKKFIGLLTLPELVALQSHLADAVALHTPAPEPTEARETFHRRHVGGRCYWYGFSRTNGKLHKRYVGRVHPETGEPA